MIKYLIFITTASSLSFAKDIGCLGFPDAKNFTCERTPSFGKTSVLLVDIPEGFSCKHPPDTGSIVEDGKKTVIYKPSVSFNSNKEGDKVANITFSPSDVGSNKSVTVTCINVKNL